MNISKLENEIAQVNSIFKEWKIVTYLDWCEFFVAYENWQYVDLISFDIMTDSIWFIRKNISDFLINIYYDCEWDWFPVSLKNIWLLTFSSKSKSERDIKEIEKKMRDLFNT